MSDPVLVVLDSSVGVKWFKSEQGQAAARDLLRRHRDGEIVLIVSAHFLHEVVSVAVRRGGAQLGERVWTFVRLANLMTVGLDDAIARGALALCAELGCTFYDALAPAIAQRIGGALFSADGRAHSRFPGVTLV